MRAFSSAFMVIQSRSPRSSPANLAASILRLRAASVEAPCNGVTRVLGLGRIDLADRPSHLVDPQRHELLPVVMHNPGEQFVEDHPRRVNVCPGVDVNAADFCLFRVMQLGAFPTGPPSDV